MQVIFQLIEIGVGSVMIEGGKGEDVTGNENSIWFLIGYGAALALLLYFGLNGLIASAMGNVFPNMDFLAVLALMIITAWLIGSQVRRSLSSINENSRNKFKNALVAVTVMSWIMVLILFSVT